MVVGDIVTSTDVFVLGAGPGGYVAALRAAELGLDVTLVEPARVGGVCLQQGCIPSKALIQAADAYERAGKLSDIGLGVQCGPVDLGRLMDWKDGVVDQLTQGVGQLLALRGVHVVQGRGDFLGPQSAAADTSEGRQAFRFRCGVVATGSRARTLDALPADGERILMPRDLLSLRAVPQELLVVGGGYIGVELGIAMRKLGARVEIVEAGREILPGADREIAEFVARRLAELGIPVRLGTSPTASARDARGVRVHLTSPEQGESDLLASHVLVSVGRMPQSSGIGLENLGVLAEDGSVRVDPQMRTTAGSIFAVGDVTGGPMLAHRASHQGIVAAEVMAGRKAAFDPAAIPAVVFGDPEIAWAGITPEQAARQGYRIEVARFPLRALGRALAGRRTEGLAKLLYDADTGVLLGAAIAGAHASDLIGEMVLALEMGATLEDVAATVHPHPTFSEAWQEAALVGLGSPIHIGGRTKR